MLVFRRHDNLPEVEERLNLLLISVVLMGYPVRRLTVHALNLAYLSGFYLGGRGASPKKEKGERGERENKTF